MSVSRSESDQKFPKLSGPSPTTENGETPELKYIMEPASPTFEIVISWLSLSPGARLKSSDGAENSRSAKAALQSGKLLTLIL